MDDDAPTIQLALTPAAFVILTAAGGFDPARGLHPALVNIISSLAQIAVAISEAMSPEEYATYAATITRNVGYLQDIVTSDQPPLAFDQLLARLRLEHEPASKTVN